MNNTYAQCWFESGMNVHDGDCITYPPQKEGYWAQFNHDGVTSCGPFKTAQEAYACGLDCANFKSVIYVAPNN